MLCLLGQRLTRRRPACLPVLWLWNARKLLPSRRRFTSYRCYPAGECPPRGHCETILWFNGFQHATQRKLCSKVCAAWSAGSVQVRGRCGRTPQRENSTF